MREILFKGKQVDNGEWVEGYYLNQRESLTDKKACYIATNNGYGFNYISVIPETVCQFTGLYDKNGRKIFEGDIVEGNSEYFTYTHPYGKVVYDGGQYLISFDDVLEDIECLGAWANDVEIIGNIYDNPELLEVKQNG